MWRQNRKGCDSRALVLFLDAVGISSACLSVISVVTENAGHEVKLTPEWLSASGRRWRAWRAMVSFWCSTRIVALSVVAKVRDGGE